MDTKNYKFEVAGFICNEESKNMEYHDSVLVDDMDGALKLINNYIIDGYDEVRIVPLKQREEL